MKHLLIAGANSFIGRHLSRYFSELGWKVSGLARRDEGLHESCTYIHWDGQSLGDWVSVIDDCDVLINLTGRSINCRHNEENKKQILESRLVSTELIGKAVAASKHPPELWINASATGIYAETYSQAHDESGAHGDTFMADVVKQWEQAFFKADIPEGVRRVALRISFVMSDEPGNAFRYLERLAKFGLGGKVGSGKQMVSWIHVDDIPRAVEHIIDHEELGGPVNMTSPHPVSNAEMMQRFRDYVGMPLGMPAPAFGVKIGTFLMGTEAELILQSSWATPDVLLESGFVFEKGEMNLKEW